MQRVRDAEISGGFKRFRGTACDCRCGGHSSAKLDRDSQPTNLYLHAPCPVAPTRTTS
jgi:hypothetical protein